MVSSYFNDVPNLSYNKKEVAKTLDKLSVDRYIRGSDLHMLIDEAWREQAVEILSELTGYFLANVVRSVSIEDDTKEIYDKIWNRSNVDNNVWAQMISGFGKYNGDVNSIGEYKDDHYGIMIGVDKYVFENIVVGIFGKYLKNSIKQGNNTAETDNFGLGAYGGYASDKIEIKTLALLMQNQYRTKRYINYQSEYLANGNIAVADFTGITVGADIEVGVKVISREKVSFTPFVGMDIKNINYGSFKEVGSEPLVLDVNGTNYLRSAGRIGARIRYYEEAGWELYASAYGSHLFIKGLSDIESVFVGTSEKFKSRGFEESNFIINIGLGASRDISEYTKLYINGNYRTGGGYENISGNIGVLYQFSEFGRGEDFSEIQERDFKEHGGEDIKEYIVKASFKKYLADNNIYEYRDKDIDDLLFDGDRIRSWVKTDEYGNVINADVLVVILKNRERRYKLTAAENRGRGNEENSSSENAVSQERKTKNISQTDQDFKDNGVSDDDKVDYINTKQVVLSESNDGGALDQLPDYAEPVEESKTIRQITLRDSNFEAKDYVLTLDSKMLITEIAEKAASAGFEKITVEAHIDDSGDENPENMLILQRAMVIVKELRLNGIGVDKIEYKNMGYRTPIASNDTEYGRASNRRIEIFIE
jgi:outer membrane protein OmpA-like peptidoglycan-associated protein